MVDNEDEKYIVLSKDLYKQYGFTNGLIIQQLINGGGEFIGSTGTLCNAIGVLSSTSVKNHLKELINAGIIKSENIGGWYHKFILVSAGNKRNKIPEKVKQLVDKIKEIHDRNGEKGI